MTIRSFGDLAAKFEKAAVELLPATMVGVLEAAAILETAVAVASGPYRGSALVKTGSIPLPGDEPRVRVKMTSRKAHLLDHDTKAHPIYPKNAAALSFNYGGTQIAVAGVQHPMTTGKFMWEIGLVAAEPLIVEAISKGTAAGLLKAFGL